jgi:alanyl-tRNA synthetase
MVVRPIALLCLIATAVVLSACGGSSSSSTTATRTVTVERSEALTLPEFIDRADAICEEENDRLGDESDEIDEELDSASTSDEFNEAADHMHAYADEIQEGLARLRELEPPDAQRSTVEDLWSVQDAQINTVERLADAVAANDGAKAENLVEELNLNKQRYGGLTQGLGLQVCGASSR